MRVSKVRVMVRLLGGRTGYRLNSDFLLAIAEEEQLVTFLEVSIHFDLTFSTAMNARVLTRTVSCSS